jgi:phage portal protein BeeE
LTTYKSAFLKNAATPNMVVSFDPGVSQEQFEAFVGTVDADHTGAANAYKTLYLGGGADVKVVGQNFEQLSLKATQGAGETRLAAAAGVPASIVGFSEGLAGSALNSGNYTAARRRFADGTMRPLWRSACGALQTIIKPPGSDARLWYDDRDVSFLQEDVKDAADIKSTEANTMESLIRAGFDPETAVAAIRTGDWGLLSHTGLVSVQLQPPGTPPAAAEQLALPVG